VKQRRKSTGTV